MGSSGAGTIAALMPFTQRALLVGINKPCRAIASALGLHGQMGAKRGFSASAFLGCHNDCFHENMLY
jgi:hypothetical protein